MVYSKIFHDNIDILESRLGKEKAAVVVYEYIRYNMTGEEPNFDDDIAAGIAFDFLRRNNDAYVDKTEEIRRKRAEAGAKGGRPKTEESKQKQTKANESKSKQIEATESNEKQDESKKSRKEKKRKEEEKEKNRKEEEVLYINSSIQDSASERDAVDNTTDDFSRCFRLIAEEGFKDNNTGGVITKDTTRILRELIGTYGVESVVSAIAQAAKNEKTIQEVGRLLRDPPRDQQRGDHYGYDTIDDIEAIYN